MFVTIFIILLSIFILFDSELMRVTRMRRSSFWRSAMFMLWPEFSNNTSETSRSASSQQVQVLPNFRVKLLLSLWLLSWRTIMTSINLLYGQALLSFVFLETLSNLSNWISSLALRQILNFINSFSNCKLNVFISLCRGLSQVSGSLWSWWQWGQDPSLPPAVQSTASKSKSGLHCLSHGASSQVNLLFISVWFLLFYANFAELLGWSPTTRCHCTTSPPCLDPPCCTLGPMTKGITGTCWPPALWMSWLSQASSTSSSQEERGESQSKSWRGRCSNRRLYWDL